MSEHTLEELTLEAGTTLDISTKFPEGTTHAIIDKLTLKKGATLTINPALKSFTILAKQAVIGKKTTINASGSKPSQNGVDLYIFFGEGNIKGLNIKTNGADGANGKNGSKGSKGRKADCFPPRSGGRGGRGKNGKNGSNGGNGGKISIGYLKQHLDGPFNIFFNPQQGTGGAGGAGGPGGDGGSGVKRCGPWPYYSVGGGPGGSRGSAGSSGQSGEPGEISANFYESEEEFKEKFGIE